MYTKVFVIVITCIVNFDVVFSGDCPASRIVKPCVCQRDSYGQLSLMCSDNTLTDAKLAMIFTKISDSVEQDDDRHYDKFTLSKTTLNTLSDTTFKGITFKSIVITENHLLVRINANAFNGTDHYVRYVEIVKNPLLSQGTDMSLFKALSKLTGVNKMYLHENNITEIPDRAFGERQTDLQELSLSMNPITMLGRYAFKGLRGLTTLKLRQTFISRINEDTFAFDMPSSLALEIYLSGGVYINGDSFAPGSLSSIFRPTTLILGEDNEYGTTKNVTYLPREAFMPFFLANDKNNVKIFGHRFDCNDCRNYWLTMYDTFVSRVKDMKCTDAKNFCYFERFAKCSPLRDGYTAGDAGIARTGPTVAKPQCAKFIHNFIDCLLN